MYVTNMKQLEMIDDLFLWHTHNIIDMHPSEIVYSFVVIILCPCARIYIHICSECR